MSLPTARTMIVTEIERQLRENNLVADRKDAEHIYNHLRETAKLHPLDRIYTSHHYQYDHALKQDITVAVLLEINEIGIVTMHCDEIPKNRIIE